jgi:uncharacterized peroxidase-related enzyme
VEQVTLDFEAAPLADLDKAMLRYARKLTQTPEAMVRDDVVALRDVGWEDAAILDICQVTAYYNYVNRLADGLGVPLESE